MIHSCTGDNGVSSSGLGPRPFSNSLRLVFKKSFVKKNSSKKTKLEK